MDRHTHVSPIEDIIDEARKGRMFILVDDEDRENEGDLVIPAEMADAEAINFMATHGRGLICLAMTRSRVDELGLAPMSRTNGTRHDTAFTVSIEARTGVTTGVSAADRARTILTAIDGANGPSDIVSPGHVFPLIAKDGGVLIRAGHTEAAVDVSRLAGLNPSGVICEIMNDDGTMARMTDLVEVARRHDLKIGTIRDLIAYRLKHDHLVEQVAEVEFDGPGRGAWRAVTHRNRVTGVDTLTLVKGNIRSRSPTLVRMHTLNVFADILGIDGARNGQIRDVMTMIGEAAAGVIVLFGTPATAVGSPAIQSHDRFPSEDIAGPEVLRDYGTGAQILADLGISDMILLTNTPHAIAALSGYGLNVVEQRRIVPAVQTGTTSIRRTGTAFSGLRSVCG